MPSKDPEADNRNADKPRADYAHHLNWRQTQRSAARTRKHDRTDGTDDDLEPLCGIKTVSLDAIKVFEMTGSVWNLTRGQLESVTTVCRGTATHRMLVTRHDGDTTVFQL